MNGMDSGAKIFYYGFWPSNVLIVSICVPLSHLWLVYLGWVTLSFKPFTLLGTMNLLSILYWLDYSNHRQLWRAHWVDCRRLRRCWIYGMLGCCFIAFLHGDWLWQGMATCTSCRKLDVSHWLNVSACFFRTKRPICCILLSLPTNTCTYPPRGGGDDL